MTCFVHCVMGKHMSGCFSIILHQTIFIAEGNNLLEDLDCPNVSCLTLYICLVYMYTLCLHITLSRFMLVCFYNRTYILFLVYEFTNSITSIHLTPHVTGCVNGSWGLILPGMCTILQPHTRRTSLVSQSRRHALMLYVSYPGNFSLLVERQFPQGWGR